MNGDRGWGGGGAGTPNGLQPPVIRADVISGTDNMACLCAGLPCSRKGEKKDG